MFELHYFPFFNSHPHKEDDRREGEKQIPKCFSTHILTRRMTMKVLITMRQKNIFNSHPHKEDDNTPSVFPFLNDSFSTHILTRRMTRNCFCWFCKTCFSTHILTRRMTRTLSILLLFTKFSTHILTRRMT